MIRNQFDRLGRRNMAETLCLLWSIQVRALTITHQLMSTNTLKDEEGVKLMKPKVEEIKTNIENIIKKITKK